MTTIYATEEQAFRRAEVLKGRGVWPGVITRTDGTFALTHDPDLLGEVLADMVGDSRSELGRERGREQRRWPVAKGRTAGVEKASAFAKPGLLLNTRRGL